MNFGETNPDVPGDYTITQGILGVGWFVRLRGNLVAVTGSMARAGAFVTSDIARKAFEDDQLRRNGVFFM